ncbi:MAG TPA: CmcI family methyltransferase, partial [Tepidisphaeraceae bacterium]|nr:CmcI family methyltransferase [Tepidisphaeraceae bacterium]
AVANAFHIMWYQSKERSADRTYFGYPIDQNPADTWLYQEILVAERPAFVLQTGVKDGGSILYFAHLLDLMKAPPEAVVVGVDLILTPTAKTLDHPRIRLVEGSSTDSATVAAVERLLPAPQGFVSLDSAHERDHVLRELDLYHRFCAVGRHLVVEDTDVNGHPVYRNHGPGPYEAVREFLARHPEFEQDDAWKRDLVSCHHAGWLRRVG